MQYRWGDYSLDREGSLLTRQGQQIDVSRKVLDCISHLLEHRAGWWATMNSCAKCGGTTTSPITS